MARLRLTPEEIARCEDAGWRRQEWNKGVRHNWGECSHESGIRHHQDGAIAEYAVAKFTGENWVAFSPNFQDLPADVGDHYQVRSTRRRGGNLILHPKDRDDQIFILVRLWNLEAAGEVELAGWIKGVDAKLPRLWEDGSKVPAFKGRDAFLIPATQLRSMRELMVVKAVKATNNPPTDPGLFDNCWQLVVFAADCRDEYGDGELLICPRCNIDYAECPCPGPTMDDEYEYKEVKGVLYARKLKGK